MVRVFPQPAAANKVSIDFLLNTPDASMDLELSPSCAPTRSAGLAGFDQLLTAASLLGKRKDASCTTHTTSDSSSGAFSKYQSGGAGVAGQEVVQPVKVKRRKRQNIKCEECGRTFGDSSSARKHHRVVHLKIKDFECEECGKTFAEKSNRSKHYIAAHLNQRSHACPDCDKVFNFTDGLRRHRNNVHLGLRPYPCPDCNTSYKQKTHLLKHRQSVHGIPIPAKRSQS